MTNGNTEYSRASDSYHHRSKGSVAGSVVFIVLAVILAVLVACIVGFSLYRWAYGNDATDVQGTWYVSDTDVAITITEDAIELNDRVSYRYILDPESKTFTISFGTLQGSGCYRFSFDRQQLALMDGTYNWWDTLLSDIEWSASALVAAMSGEEKTPAGAGDVTLLYRKSATFEEPIVVDDLVVPDESPAPEAPADESDALQPVPDDSDAPDGTDDQATDDSNETDNSDEQNEQDAQDARDTQTQPEGNDMDTFGIYDFSISTDSSAWF